MTSIEPSYSRATGRLALLAAAVFLVGTNAFVIAGVLPLIAADLGVDADRVSLAITYYAVVVAIGAPAISILCARVPRGLLMGIGLLTFAIGTAVAASATSLVVLDLGRALAGVGGAALVPTATATAASLVTPQRRGRALAVVGAGFTFATAIGAPLGTAVAGIAGWRNLLWVIVASGVVLAAGILVGVRRVPKPPQISLLRRFAPLRHGRIVAPLGSTAIAIAGFNVVYIFSSIVTRSATDGSATLLATLLLSFGLAGVLGNAIAGPMTDRFGSGTVGVTALVAQAVILLALPVAGGSFLWTAALFALWGLSAFASIVPTQHRLVEVAPHLGSQSLSWYSTAMYLGIALAPLLGTAAVRTEGVVGVTTVGGLASLLAAVLLLLSWSFTFQLRRAGALSDGS